MARNPEYDVTLDGVGYILTRDGLGVSRVQANPYAMKSSSGERTYADLDEWAVFQVSSCHRGMGQERYGDPEQFWYSTGADTRFKDKIICGPKVTTLDPTTDIGGATGTDDFFLVQFEDALYCGSADTVYELVAGSWTSRDEVAAANITSMCAYNGYLCVARGAAEPIRKSDDGTTWAGVGGTPNAKCLYVHGGFLYRSYIKTVLYSSDPEAASPTWSTGITIGSTDYSIKSMCTYQNSLIVFKNDGAWRVPGNPGDLDTAYRVPELDWRSHIHSNNGRFSCVWSDGFLYVVVGKAGLLRWTGRTVTPIGPNTLLIGTLKGQIAGLIPTPNFLYTTLAGGTAESFASHILAWNGSGWHSISQEVPLTTKDLCYFDTHLYWGGYEPTTYQRNQVYQAYTAQGTLDPTQDPDYLYATSCELHLSKFTANLHETYKELRSITLWLDNQGGTATSGAQTVTIGIAVDRAGTTGDGHTSFTVYDDGQHIFRLDLTIPSPTFSDKQLASINATRDAVTLASGYDYDDIDLAGGITSGTRTWAYFEGVNEYRNIISKTAPNVLNLQCPLDDTPAADSWIRPGIQHGRYVLPYLQLNTADEKRTPVVFAVVLKYLVNIKDYDIWQLNVQLADPLTLRNGNTKRQPIADQLERLDEIRKKGRVAFVDETGDSHTVKITNYSLQPNRQRVDSKMEAETEYTAKLTLLEV